MIKKLEKIIRNIIRHPHARKNVLVAISKFIFWQLTAPKKDFKLYLWQNGIKVLVRRGMTGFTGNIYCEYYEYEDMMLLQDKSNDFQHFIDVGANVGAYTLHVLNLDKNKSAISYEPNGANFETLSRNIDLNHWAERWDGINKCVGPDNSKVLITKDLDTKNQVINSDMGSQNTVEVEQTTLDQNTLSKSTFMKIDVEGYELSVLAGATELLQDAHLKLIIIETVTDEIEKLLEASGFKKGFYDVSKATITQNKPKNYFTKNTIFYK